MYSGVFRIAGKKIALSYPWCLDSVILLRTAACQIKLGGGMDASTSTIWIKGACVLASGFAHKIENIKEM